MNTITFDLRCKMVERFEKALLDYNRTGNARQLLDAQREIQDAYERDLTRNGVPSRTATRIAKNVMNKDIQVVADKAQRIKL